MPVPVFKFLILVECKVDLFASLLFLAKVSLVAMKGEQNRRSNPRLFLFYSGVNIQCSQIQQSYDKIGLDLKTLVLLSDNPLLQSHSNTRVNCPSSFCSSNQQSKPLAIPPSKKKKKNSFAVNPNCDESFISN